MFEELASDAPAGPLWLVVAHAGPHRNLHYLVGDPATRRALAVDPAFELDALLACAARDGFEVEAALITHGHWDHIGGAPEAVERGIRTVVAHPKAIRHPKLQEAKRGGAALLPMADGQRIDVVGIPVEVLHTPGHQPDAVCYLVGPDGGPKLLFAGDTLFVGSCGRTDFAGGDTAAMHNSMARLRGLAASPHITLMPGHWYHDNATRALRAEVERNPALAPVDLDAFSRLPFLRG